MTDIYLVSASARRKELLSQFFNVRILTQNVRETTRYCRPHLAAMDLAAKKMDGVACFDERAVYVSADTLVWFQGARMGKPKTQEEANKMLRTLSGHTHAVYSGVCVKKGGRRILFYDKSLVRFKCLSDREILAYIETGSPFDKAGGYGIQDGAVVKAYRGSYSNIVGLPMEKLMSVLEKEGLC